MSDSLPPGYPIFTTVLEELLDRASSYVQRWHNKSVRTADNLAEHHYYVAYTAYILARLAQLTGCDIDLGRVVITALTHDHTERITGDIPGSLKRMHPDARRQVEEWERFVIPMLWKGMPVAIAAELRAHLQQYSGGVETDEDDCARKITEHSIVKFADLFDVYSFLYDEVKVHHNDALLNIYVGTAQELYNAWQQLEWAQAIAACVDNSIGQHLGRVLMEERGSCNVQPAYAVPS